MIEYLEELPDDCPPEDAIEIKESLAIYRLIKDDSPTDYDFYSQRKRNPMIVHGYGNEHECMLCGLSVFKSVDKLKNLGRYKRSKETICLVRLTYGAGRIKLTNPKNGHHTWWPLKGFDILGHCKVID